MRIIHDLDDWETITESRPCSTCGGDLRKCNGGCNGMFSIGSRRRAPEEVAAIKAKRQREHEDAVLAEAELIRLRRALPTTVEKK